MLIRDIGKIKSITAGDGCTLRELLNPETDPVALGCSIAHATVKEGETTLLHSLKGSEVYYVIQGEGEMRVDDEAHWLLPGQAVYIPPGARQRIRNTGTGELRFLCIADPAWKKEDEEIHI